MEAVDFLRESRLSSQRRSQSGVKVERWLGQARGEVEGEVEGEVDERSRGGSWRDGGASRHFILTVSSLVEVGH